MKQEQEARNKQQLELLTRSNKKKKGFFGMVVKGWLPHQSQKSQVINYYSKDFLNGHHVLHQDYCIIKLADHNKARGNWIAEEVVFVSTTFPFRSTSTE